MVFSNGLLFGASAEASGGGGGFDTTLIPNSIQLNGTDERFSRNTSGSPSTTKLIMGCWFQLNKIPLSANQGLMFQGNASGSGSDQVGLFFSYDSSQIEMDLYFYCNGQRASPRMAFRGVGWYHILASYDLGQSGTAKGKLFINGIEITDYNQDLRSSWGTSFNSTATQQVGGMATNFFPGSIAQPVMLDGQSVQDGDVAITDFVDAFTFGTNGSQFVPKANADIAALATTAGGNSFCLDFETTGGTSEANLGLDISDNSNNLTPANMAASNQSTNTPSKTFSIFNPLANGDQTSSDLGSFSLSNNNKTVTLSSSNQWLKTTIPFVMSGSNIIRTEFTIDTTTNGLVGITGSPHSAGTYHTSALGIPGRGEVGLLADGSLVIDGNFGGSGYTSSWSNGDIIDVIVNLDAGAVWFARNGTLGGGASQAEIQAGTTTNAAIVSSFVRRTAGEVFNFYVAQTNPSGPTFTYNSGQTAFSNSYSTITSLVPLSTADLTAPTFQGADFYNNVGYTGNGSARSITGAGFQPDLVWFKSRAQVGDTTSDSWGVYDAIRGVQKQLFLNGPRDSVTSSETTQSQGLTAFGSDGFSIGTLSGVNNNTTTFTAYNFLGQNGTTSISSGTGKLASTVSVAEAGHFSIVSYTGSGANTTVGHGLSIAPQLVIYKNRDTADEWSIYCEFLSSAANHLAFDNDAQATDATMFNSTAPTTSVLSLGSSDKTNKSTSNMIAYCFASVAGVCKVGSYEGNANNDGPYISLGFNPKMVIVKNIDAGSTGWTIWDTILNPVASGNPYSNWMLPDSNGGVGTSGFDLDFLGNAIKPRGTTSSYVNAANTYIYLAMADIGGNGTLPPIYGR